MSDFKSRCMNCMSEVDFGHMNCPNCSCSMYLTQDPTQLAMKTILMDKYLVGAAIDVATDFITYIGLDLQTNQLINIHEFFPNKICERAIGNNAVNVNAMYEQTYFDLQNSFISLWQTLCSISDCFALPDAYDIFNQNNTSYAISIAHDCITLEQYIQESDVNLTWNQVYNSFTRTILTAIRKLHANSIFHARISPKTIMVGSDGKLRLDSISIPEVQIPNSAVSLIPDDNFSAIEVFDQNAAITASSDIYSTFACMIYLFTKVNPRPSYDYSAGETFVLPQQLSTILDSKHTELITRALTISPEDRLKNTSDIGKIMNPEAFAKNNKRTVKIDKSKYDDQDKENKGASLVFNDFVDKVKNDEETKGQIILGLKIAIGVLAVAIIIAIFLIFQSDSQEAETPDWLTNTTEDITDEVTQEATEEETTIEETTAADEVTTTATEDLASTTTVVPNFLILAYDTIVSNTTFNSNFSILYEFQYSDTIASNSIISQSITANSEVAIGTEITIVVSKGSEPIVLVDVRGYSYSDAETLLTELGFVVSQDTIDNSGEKTANEVYMMSLVAGLEFDVGTEIMLTVWGEAPTTTEATTEEETTEEETTEDETTTQDESSDDSQSETE